MPQLRRVFDAGVASAQLTLSLFLAGFAVGQLVCGPLSDRLGRRPLLLGGLALFTLAGLACAASASIFQLVAFRFVQGMGASVGPILARAIVRDRFEGREASAMLSQITQIMVVAPLLAPTLGGYLLVYLGWRAIFLVLGVSGAILWLVCSRYLPETARPGQAGGSAGFREGLRGLFGHRSSLRHTLTVCFSYAGMFAYISGSPFVFIDVFGVARERFGYFFALTAAALMVGATVNRALLARRAPALLLRRGVWTVFAAGLVLALLAWLGIGGLAGVVVPMMAYLFGMGLLQPNATAAALAPHGRIAGLASSLMGGLQTSGGALAGYLVGAFFDHTSRPLALTVAVFAILAFLVSERADVTGEAVRETESELAADLPQETGA